MDVWRTQKFLQSRWIQAYNHPPGATIVKDNEAYRLVASSLLYFISALHETFHFYVYLWNGSLMHFLPFLHSAHYIQYWFVKCYIIWRYFERRITTFEQVYSSVVCPIPVIVAFCNMHYTQSFKKKDIMNKE